jgi:phosphomevalonate kinase
VKPVAVFAPGKLFVIGEYAVLAGGRALVAAVDAGIRCRATEEPGGWRVSAPDLALDASLTEAAEHPGGRLLAAAVCKGAREFGVGRALRVHVEGTRPASRTKRGLGGSAASVAAILGALALAGGAALESRTLRERLFRLALSVHREHQNGRGSGADVAAAVHGGWVDFLPSEGGPRVVPAAVPEDLRLIAAWSGASADTAAALGGAVPPAAIAPMRTVLARFWRAIEQADRAGIVEAISEYGAVLDVLGRAAGGRGAESIARLVEAARSPGAAAKGSGAIGGDCAIALGFDPARLRAIEERWRRGGAEVLDLAVDRRGLRREPDHA